MCLAIPGRITSIDGASASADFGGVSRKVSLDLVPEAREGDFILVHAGFAIQLLDENDARETLDLFKRLYGGPA
jgi:hydrogenase expression/formation protein HypC